MDTDAWEKAGIYDPASPTAAERRALLEYLSARGATIAQMVEAAQMGALPAVAGTLVRGPDPQVTVEELADRCRVPPEMVRRVLLAAGLQVEEGEGSPSISKR